MTTADFLNFCLKSIAVFQIKFSVSFDSDDKQSKRL